MPSSGSTAGKAKAPKLQTLSPGLPLSPNVQNEAGFKSAVPDIALFSGFLSVQHLGRLEKKFFVLYRDRLDYFDNAVDPESGQGPIGRMVLAEVISNDVFGVGIILDILGRKVGLKANNEAEVKDWDAHIKSAMINVRQPGFSPMSMSERSRSRARSNSPGKHSNSRVMDFRSVKSSDCPQCGGSSAASEYKSAASTTLSRSKSADARSNSRGGRSLGGTSIATSESGSSPNKRASKNSEDKSWVHLPSFNRFKHIGGRPWVKSEIKHSVFDKEAPLKEANNFHKVPKHPVSSKINGDNACGSPVSADFRREAVTGKVNVEVWESRATVKTVAKEKSANLEKRKVLRQALVGSGPPVLRSETTERSTGVTEPTFRDY